MRGVASRFGALFVLPNRAEAPTVPESGGEPPAGVVLLGLWLAYLRIVHHLVMSRAESDEIL